MFSKISSAAKIWSTTEQEAYGIFFSVQKSAYCLRDVRFHVVVVTDKSSSSVNTPLHNQPLWLRAGVLYEFAILGPDRSDPPLT